MGIALAHAPGKLAERLIRGGSMTVNQPAGEPLYRVTNWLEGQGHDRGRDDGQRQALAVSRVARAFLS